MRTIILIAVVIFCLASPAAAQKDSVSKKKIYKTWLLLNRDQGKIKGILYDIKDSSILLSDSKYPADYRKGNFKVYEYQVSSINTIKIRRMRNINKGALLGMAAGFVAGVVTGALLSEGNTGAALWAGSWGLGLGAAVGAAIGSVKISIPVHGDHAKFTRNLKKLKACAYQRQYIPLPKAHFTRLHSIVKDTDGTVYTTLTLAGQVWMAGNLRVTRYRNGDVIPGLNNNKDWEQARGGADCRFMNDSLVTGASGLLYNWNAVTDSRGLCPRGWHVPSITEWSSLVACLGGESEAGKTLSESIPAVTGNLSEDPFALPVGFRFPGGDFSSRKGMSYEWWSSTTADSLTGKAFYMGNADGGIMFTNTGKHAGLPVRCLRD